MMLNFFKELNKGRVRHKKSQSKLLMKLSVFNIGSFNICLIPECSIGGEHLENTICIIKMIFFILYFIPSLEWSDTTTGIFFCCSHLDIKCNNLWVIVSFFLCWIVILHSIIIDNFKNMIVLSFIISFALRLSVINWTGKINVWTKLKKIRSSVINWIILTCTQTKWNPFKFADQLEQ